MKNIIASISKITKNPKGDTHFGRLAHAVLYGKKKISVYPLSDDEKFFVFLDSGRVELSCWIGTNKDGLNIFLERKISDGVNTDSLLIVEI